jgi:hypothetical protein
MTTTTDTAPVTDTDDGDSLTFRRAVDIAIAAVPIVLLNALAVIGQTQWAHANLHWNWPGRIVFAGALETIALSVLYRGHRSRIEGDSAILTRLFAYVIAGGSATINWQDHANHWAPTPAAFVFAGASVLSPILWDGYSKFAAREEMRRLGLLDKRAAKFSVGRWVTHPVRTRRALWYSIWYSEQSPTVAIVDSERHHAARKATGETAGSEAPAIPVVVESETETEEHRRESELLQSMNKADAIRRTVARLGTSDAARVSEELSDHGVTVNKSHLYRVMADLAERVTPITGGRHAIGS